MPNPFVATRFNCRLPLLRTCALGPRRRAANDNGSASPEPDERSDRLLAAALHCLSEHGLRAAREACDRAERAFRTGDRTSCDWWLGICRMLDRRLANDLADEEEIEEYSQKLD